jgi:signal transduction histidine kinase
VTSTGAAAAKAVPPTGSVLAELLHALNQPLTGLQCSMELAVSAARTPEQQIRTLREGLELTARMRLLVETIRELTDVPQADCDQPELFRFDSLVSETAADLEPVAKEKSVRLMLECRGPLLVRADRRRLAGLTFRLLESALALTKPGADVLITTASEQEQASLVVSWCTEDAPNHSPLSRAELSLIIARAGWEKAATKWSDECVGQVQTCAIRLSLAAASATVSTV